MSTIESVGRESRRVIHGAAGWAPARWRLPIAAGHGDRCTVMRELIQTMADLAAEAEGITARRVPSPTHEPGLCDQLAVMVADFIAAEPGPEQCDAALAAIGRARAGLFR